MNHFRNLSDDSVIEKDKHDFVTKVDKESELLITSLLIENFPSIPVFGEEFEWSNTSTKNDIYWVIDPLDGTKNYIQGLPYFCISIALIKNNKPIVGVIFDPLHKEFYYAEKNKGAYLNDNKIIVSERTNLDHGFISTGFPFRNRK